MLSQLPIPLEVFLFAMFSSFSYFPALENAAGFLSLHLLLYYLLAVFSARLVRKSPACRLGVVFGFLSATRLHFALFVLLLSLLYELPKLVFDVIRTMFIVIAATQSCKSWTGNNGTTETQSVRSQKGKYANDEGVRLLDAIEQGYFVCRRVTDLDPTNGFSVVYTNRKAREIIRDVEGGVGCLFERLSTLEDLPKNLREVVLSVLEDTVNVGACVKTRFGIQLGHSGSENLAASVRPETSFKTIPFKYLKAWVWKISASEVILVMGEQCPISIAKGSSELGTVIACTLTHELRTLTNGIIGNIQLLGEDRYEENKMYRVHHEIALCSSYLLVNRLNDLFDYMQLTNKGFKPHYTQFPIEEVFLQLQQIIRPLANEKQIAFSIDRRSRLPVMIVCDQLRLQQILTNIAIKALEFTDYGSIALRVKLTKDKMLSFAIISMGTTMHAKLEKIMNESKSTTLKKKRESDLSSGGTKNADSTENLEALSLQITQLICKELGTNVVAKSVAGRNTQLKFKIRDGFPEQTKGSDPSRELRRCATNWREKKTVPISFANGSHKFRLIFAGLENRPLPTHLGVPSTSPARKYTVVVSTFAPHGAPEIDEAEQPDEEVPSEIAMDVTLPEAKRCPALDSHPQISIVAGPFTELSDECQSQCAERVGRTAAGSKDSSPMANRPRRTTAMALPPFNTEIKCGTVDDVDKCRVLIADDNTINRFVLKSLLKKHGLNSIEARDGKEALTLIERYSKAGMLHELKLVFMDLQMPVMNGIQSTSLIRKICGNSRELPIIGVSSDPVEKDRVRFVQAGLNEFMNKPVDNTKILYAIKKYIHK